MVNNATKADTLMATPQSPIEPTKPEKRKLRFEAGAGLIAFQQQAYTPYNLQPRGETARQATALSGAYGTQAQAALLYPLGKGFWLRPCIGFSALYQQAWVQSSPGPNAQVTLRYNADSSEITGAPTLASTTMRESRILVLPTASLSLLWQPGRLSFFAGSHFTTALTMAETEGAKTGKPTVEAISYHAGARYTLTPNLTLQADARRLNLTQNALPGITGSKSQGWLLGLGLIWNWQ